MRMSFAAGVEATQRRRRSAWCAESTCSRVYDSAAGSFFLESLTPVRPERQKPWHTRERALGWPRNRAEAMSDAENQPRSWSLPSTSTSAGRGFALGACSARMT
eukprot:Mycagemm_TRINITY_DN10311_c3_g9::TRINITY_DN10311_c3_g9_i2::g.1233::m.1233 type:complete len:104 gc:universal TRINITY_DN10311_c3_g9_i2:924-1235(+)